MSDPVFQLRAPCPRCGGGAGKLIERGAQDCVYCLGCGAFCYNAPRSETGKEVRHVKTREAIPPKRRTRILMRASGHCELCGASGELHVGHLLSVVQGRAQGLTDEELDSEENLAALCASCNLGMGAETVPLRIAIGIVMARVRNSGRVVK